jgi:hypothetical protein
MNSGSVISASDHVGTLFQEMDRLFLNTLSVCSSKALLTLDEMLVVERTLCTLKEMDLVE